MKSPVVMLPAQRFHQMDLFETVAPDVKCAVKPAAMPAPRHGMMTWQASEKHIGLFKPMIETHPAVADLKEWNPKIYGVSKDVIRTLVEAGFVEGEKLSPRTLCINLESWFRHRAVMRDDPFFWSDAENLKRYSDAWNRIKSRDGREGRDRRGGKKRAGFGFKGGMAPKGVEGPKTKENAQNPLGELGETASRPDRVGSPVASGPEAAKSTETSA